MDSRGQNGFRLLWPVVFLERMLSGHEQSNHELEQLILKREEEHEHMTTDYLDKNLFSLKSPAVDWLNRSIHKSAIDYCKRAGQDYPIDWSLQGWANVNRLGDYHDPPTTIPMPT